MTCHKAKEKLIGLIEDFVGLGFWGFFVYLVGLGFFGGGGFVLFLFLFFQNLDKLP